MNAVLNRSSLWAARATGALVVIMASICMGSLIWQVVTRYLLGRASSWTEELAMFLFAWIVLLASSLGVREGFHVRLTVALDVLSVPGRRWAERIIGVLVIGFGAALVYYGAVYVDRTWGQVSAAVRYPIWLLNLAAPVSGALIVLHGLTHLLSNDLSEKREP